ncbi:hypothetical protein LTR62_003914 [Meristemomyces frigidus]|uniref:Uncharacterized protein n=1 Tax=Meristemomyces frigidus TaxID=1508187 RepID=A0AAN7TG37_9PEZI|nr:hypothetical protein LTR62_003914 [Meristemomyces frigidus]
MTGKTTGSRMGNWFRNILSRCDKGDEERPALQISGPSNFRREDISIPGLDHEQQRWIREKAVADAGRMWDHLQPLRSSPSGQFAAPQHQPATLPTYEEFTTPRHAPPEPSPTTATAPARRPSVSSHALERVRAHARKLSNSLSSSKPSGGYQAVTTREGGNPYEMRALIDASSAGLGKGSGEGWSVAGSEEERVGGRF